MIERYIGGEPGGRSFFGGRRNKARTRGLIIVAIGGGVGVILWRVPALIVAVLAALVVFAVTAGTHHGSVLQRWQNKRRWRERNRHGLVVFRPVSMRPEDLTERLMAAPRKERARIQREWNTYRDWPDGVEGLNWLECAPGEPGILWHTPTGEEPYFSVAFPIEGQIQGLQSDQVVDRAAARYGAHLAAYGHPGDLVTRIQTLTRLTPIDSARHERWVWENLDPDAPRILLESYDEVLRMLGRGALGQRHFAVVRWPMTTQFTAKAARLGAGPQGWRILLAREIDKVQRRLMAAGAGPGNALTAAQWCALVRHLQVPSWPIDQSADVEVMWPWMPSEDNWSYTRVEGPGPSGQVEQWFHRTARVPIDSVGTGPRTPLWLMPLMSQLPTGVMRSVSIEVEVIPAQVALAQAREDLTSDLADLESQRSKGALTSEELEVSASGAKARRADLTPGSGVQGAAWAMHISLSTTSVEELGDACALVEETCATDLDISQLEWMDTYQAAAHAACWPVARGMAPVAASRTQQLRTMLAGTGSKEALQ